MEANAHRAGRAGLALAAALWVLAAAPRAFAQPANVVAAPTFVGAGIAAAVATGTGFATVVLVADQTGNALRFYNAATRAEIGTPFGLVTGCAPRDLLQVGAKLFVACSGTAQIEVLNLTAFTAASPVPALLYTIAVGQGPDRLFQHQSGGMNLLFVQNATDKTVSVISLTGANAPIGIKATDSTEVANRATAPAPVAVCGPMPATSQAQGVPVGMGAGIQRIYVACDASTGTPTGGRLSYFDPFAGGDFSQSVPLDPGLPRLAAGTGAAGIFGFYVQATDGNLSVIDISQAESGGPISLLALSSSGLPQFSVQGPSTPQGLAVFADSLTAVSWLAAWGGASSPEADFFDVSDLANPAYVPPATRTASAVATTGMAAFSGTGTVRAAYAAGNLFLPGGSTQMTFLSSGPVFGFTPTAVPLAMSSQADPGLGNCTSILPLQNAWTASPSIVTGTFAPTLKKSTNPALPLTPANLTTTAGDAPITAPDATDLTGQSEEMALKLYAQDAAGYEALFEYPVLLDGTRPEDVTNVVAKLDNDTITVDWSPVSDPGAPLAAGIDYYVVRIERDNTALTNPPHVFLEYPTAPPFSVAISTLDSANPSFIAGETISISVAACDAAGNRSLNMSVLPGLRAGGGVTAAFGETGGCVLSQGGGAAEFLGVLLPAAFLIFRRRRSVRERRA